MGERSTLRSRAALFDAMGQAAGLDLQEEAIAGRLQFGEIAEAVLRCSRCAHPQTCQGWLQDPGRKTARHDTPDYCRNRDLLGYLQEQAR